MNLPLDCFCLIRSGSAGKEVNRDHSQKQGLLGTIMASSFKSELNKIMTAKSDGFGGSCMVAARKSYIRN